MSFVFVCHVVASVTYVMGNIVRTVSMIHCLLFQRTFIKRIAINIETLGIEN